MDDRYARDYDAAVLSRNQLQQDLNTKSDLQSKGQNTAKVDATIRMHHSNLLLNLDSLQRTIDGYKDPGIRHKITQKQKEQRIQQTEQLQTDFDLIEERVKAVQTQKPLRTQTVRDPIGENQNHTGAVHSSVGSEFMQREQQRRSQAEQEERILGTADNLIYLGKNMNDEIAFQQPLLDEINDKADRNLSRLEKGMMKINKMLDRSSDLCLIILIIVLMLVLVLIIFFA